ncbi:MAG: phosphatidate cytidylyltransferase [Bdellovibrionota bacterium]
MTSRELPKRITTGLLGAVLFLAILVYGGWIGAFVITAMLAMGMLHEFSDMVFTLPDKAEKRYFMLSIAWLAVLLGFFAPSAFAEILVAGFLAMSVYFLAIANRHVPHCLGDHFKELMYSSFCLLYILLPLLYFSRMLLSQNGVYWTILFFMIIWASDTGAFFGGRRFGRKRLYPAISPKKTVEGAAIGLASGVMAALLFKTLAFGNLGWLSAIVIPIIIGPSSQIGDLAESFLKRAFNRKDSGTFFPGHGGFLDRFDGVVFSMPVMYACMKVFS